MRNGYYFKFDEDWFYETMYDQNGIEVAVLGEPEDRTFGRSGIGDVIDNLWKEKSMLVCLLADSLHDNRGDSVEDVVSQMSTMFGVAIKHDPLKGFVLDCTEE